MCSIDSAIIKALVEHIGMDSSIVPDEGESTERFNILTDITPGSPYLGEYKNLLTETIEFGTRTHYGFKTGRDLSLGDILLLQRTDGSYLVGIVVNIPPEDVEDITVNIRSLGIDGSSATLKFVYDDATRNYREYADRITSTTVMPPDGITTGFYTPSNKVFSEQSFWAIILKEAVLYALQDITDQFPRILQRIAALESKV